MPKREDGRNYGKSKMTVVMFHTEGDDDTLREGFRTVSLAMTSLLKPAHAAVLKREVAPAALPEAVDTSALDNQEQAQEQKLDIDEPVETLRPSRARTYRSPEVINDLDLMSGSGPLRAFLEGKDVGDNESKRQLAIAVWLKEQRGIKEIGADHIYTCYRHMGWNPGKDVTAVLRSLKKAGCFSRGSKSGMFAINHIGEARIMASSSQ